MRSAAIIASAVILTVPIPVRAQAPVKAARELAEALLRKVTGTAVKEGAEQASGRLAAATATAAARHGDGALAAIRKVGPKAISLADDAGKHGPQAMRLLAKHGDEAVAIVNRPQAMSLVSRFGDDATGALLKHPAAAEPLIEAAGAPAIRALTALAPQNARRLAMLQAGGELASIGRTEELLTLIGRHGDRAMAFIWQHKASLAVAATLTTFLANPEPYLSGAESIAIQAIESTADAAGTMATSAIAPVATAAVAATGQAVQTALWVVACLTVMGVAAPLARRKLGLPWKRAETPAGD